MDNLSRADLVSLMQSGGAVRVSIYMPTHRQASAADTREDAIRFKNLLTEAENQLLSQGVRSGEARQMLEPARRLLIDGQFWRNQAEGLAAFIGPEGTRHYRLPIRFEPLALAGNRWHIKPLVGLFAEAGRFYVLALNLDGVRLLRCTRRSVTPVDLGRTLASLEETLRLEVQEKQLQFHTQTSAFGPGDRPAMYHGSGSIADEAVWKAKVQEFLRRLDSGLERIFHDEHAPMVLAGVEYVRAMYREMTFYGHVLADGIEGSTERVSDEELRDRAWPAVEEVFLAARRQAGEQYQLYASKGRGTSRPEEALPAAFDGRVATLFVPVGVQWWGRYDSQTRDVAMHDRQEPGDEDLLDLLAVQTLQTRGEVFLEPLEAIPGGGPLAAMYRY